MKSVLVVLLALYAIHACHGLSCAPPDTVRCDQPRGCRYGTVKDVCGYCDECGKGPGEVCGGQYGVKGACGRNMKCHIEDPDPLLYGFDEGTCVSTSGVSTSGVSTSGVSTSGVSTSGVSTSGGRNPGFWDRLTGNIRDRLPGGNIRDRLAGVFGKRR